MLTTDELAGLDQRFHVIVEPVGGAARSAALRLLRPLGRMVVVGNASDTDQVLVGTNDLWIENAGVVGLNIAGLLGAEPERVGALADRALEVLADSNPVQPQEDMPLADASQAHRRLESRSVTRRLVLAP